MKRTTYILIGLFIAGLFVLAGGMFVMYLTGEPYSSNVLVLKGEQMTKELPPFRVIWLTQNKVETESLMIWMADSRLDVLPSEEGKNSLSFPEEVNDYLSVEVMGDTLKILFDYPVDKLPPEFKDAKFMGMKTGDWRLHLTQEAESIINDMGGQHVVLEKISRDSLSIDTSNSFTVNACDLTALNVIRSGRKAEFQSGNIHRLHLNLDWMGDWSVNTEKCHIDTEYLAGRGKVLLQKGECKRMFWVPTQADTKLEVTLTEKACVTME